MKSRIQKGFTVVEIIISATIIVAVVVGASLAWQAYIHMSSTGTFTTEASLAYEEAAEALQLMRDNGWTANIAPLVNGTTYYLHWSGAAYSLTTTAESSQNITRTIVFSAVNRDAATNAITTSGGIADAGSRYATITVYPTGNPAQVLISSKILLNDVYGN